MRNDLLYTSNLTIGYGHTLLHDLNLRLEPGKLICFMGPNGVGKSTLIRTLAGLQKPKAGSVHNPAGKVSSSIAVVLTERVFSTYLTVAEVVMFGRYPYLEWNLDIRVDDLRIVTETLHKVGITELAAKRVEELSDGQLQLAMIARAIAQDTPIILLDEPTAHLDLNNRLQVMDLLRQLAHDDGKSILVATHELDLSLQTADLIWLAGRDQRIHTGIPEELILSGIFDETFELKGFDLRTGRIKHRVSHSEIIEVIGEGFVMQWTKNALERSGFQVSSDKPTRVVKLAGDESNPRWEVDNTWTLNSIHSLLEFLISAKKS